jgi:hypothetical protein
MHGFSESWVVKDEKIPFRDAIRSETHVLETTRRATASSCAPCLSNTVGTWIHSNSPHINYIVAIYWSS